MVPLGYFLIMILEFGVTHHADVACIMNVGERSVPTS